MNKNEKNNITNLSTAQIIDKFSFEKDYPWDKYLDAPSIEILKSESNYEQILEENIKKGYNEIIPPLLVNKNSAFGTGQLPDKDDVMYYIDKTIYI